MACGYMSCFSISGMLFGLPDIGLLSQSGIVVSPSCPSFCVGQVNLLMPELLKLDLWLAGSFLKCLAVALLCSSIFDLPDYSCNPVNISL